MVCCVTLCAVTAHSAGHVALGEHVANCEFKLPFVAADAWYHVVPCELVHFASDGKGKMILLSWCMAGNVPGGVVEEHSVIVLS